MAVEHTEIPVTRTMMQGWIDTWRAAEQPKPRLRKYVEDQMEFIEEGLSKTEINVSERDDYGGNTVLLIDMMMDDIKSYG